MAWRPANSLVTLRNQLNESYPGWLFLGFLGDQSHATVASDHNPNSAGVVTALDIGPGGGLDIHKLADNILANPHPNLKYIISNRRIGGSHTNWKWQSYGGSDPHGTHIHISVGVGSDGRSVQPYDDTTKWNIGGKPMPSDAQITAFINYEHFIAFGKAPSQEVIDSWRGLLKQDFVKGALTIQESNNKSPDALKNQKTGYVPVTEQLFKKG